MSTKDVTTKPGVKETERVIEALVAFETAILALDNVARSRAGALDIEKRASNFLHQIQNCQTRELQDWNEYLEPERGDRLIHRCKHAFDGPSASECELFTTNDSGVCDKCRQRTAQSENDARRENACHVCREPAKGRCEACDRPACEDHLGRGSSGGCESIQCDVCRGITRV